jgi:RNA polymerase sigma-70 factor (ECF subfamily)
VNPDLNNALPPFMEDPDIAFMLQFQEGDDGAFKVLVAKHTDALVNYFFYQSGDRSVAEDCTQEVWSRIFRSRGEYEPRARFRTFLFRVARNLWIDQVRSGARRGRTLRLDAEGEDGSNFGAASSLAAPGAPPEESLREQELAQALAKALAKLPEEMREVFVLGGIEGIPYGEIAETLDIPVGTVKSRIFNAVRRLRESLKPFWEKEV